MEALISNKLNTKRNAMHNWAIVEKRNHLAIHQLFESQAAALKFLAETVPIYCQRGYYMDKTLTPESFEVVHKLQHKENCHVLRH